MKIGKNLKKFRDFNKLSQEEVADLIGVERKTYSRWESDITDVKSSFLPKLAEIYNVDISDFFKKLSPEVVINQTNNDDSSYNSIILILPDTDSANEFLKVIKERVGTKES